MPLRAASCPTHALVLCLQLLPHLSRLASPAPASSSLGRTGSSLEEASPEEGQGVHSNHLGVLLKFHSGDLGWGLNFHSSQIPK